MHKKLRELRMMLRLAQYTMAKGSGVGRTRLSLFENGHIDLQPAELRSISAVLEKAAAERVSEISAMSATGTIREAETA